VRDLLPRGLLSFLADSPYSVSSRLLSTLTSLPLSLIIILLPPLFTIHSKVNTNSKAYSTAQRLIKSYFVSLQALLQTVASDSGIPALAVTESAKLVPWVVGNRKVARGWVKVSSGV
jgi:hypothetical protein